ncbi:DJ-1/PfpI family protein [Pseudodesulfovibrio portus]|uniref:DJ-1/PfpI family protein n=1 Tax=Pseudodesulfovibrio portus TaxID=231439 RepID=UPI0022320917|nr:DJ-1/PfpI family protein [Pseudodesulfovibrio portus]
MKIFMKTACLAILFLAFAICAASTASAGSQGKKALLIVAKSDFSATEYSRTRSALESGGMDCTVASSAAGPCKGDSGKRATAEMALSSVNAADYDAIVIIGGNGIMKMWKNPEAHRIVQEAVAQDKVVAAICAGPGILAHAGVMQGKRATAYSGSPSSALKEHGATYTGKKVEVDGRFITGNGPKAASGFGKAIVAAFE